MTGSTSPPLFRRKALLAAILTKIEQGEYVAIWGPRYSGRTTIIHQIRHELAQRTDCLAVYTVPADNLDPSSREQLFRSLAQHIQNEYLRLTSISSDFIQGISWNHPDALQEFLAIFLKATDLRRLIVLLDDCDQLLSTSLIDLIRALRVIYHQRGMAEWRSLKRLSFVVAGAVSFRNLKLLETDELSPFDDWIPFRITDLASSEMIDYLSLIISTDGHNIDPDALRLMIDYCGGDLNRINQFCSALFSTEAHAITPYHVEKVARQLIAVYRLDPSTSYMIGVITHDPRCLQVLDRLRKGSPQFIKNQLHKYHDHYFGISNPELSGGFVLEKNESGEPVYWRFRNRFSQETLSSHFDAASMMRAFLDLGRPKDCLRFASELKAELAKNFDEAIFSFDEVALREVVEAQWEHQPGDRIEKGFDLIASVLEIFGYEDVILYDKPPSEERLVPNKLLPTPPFNVTAPQAIDVDDRSLASLREVRVYRSSVYSVEIQAGGYLKTVIPLKDSTGERTGIISIRSKTRQESWATLFVRIPIVERSLNFVWRKLSRVEAEKQAMLQQVGNPQGSMPRMAAAEGIPVFVATKFNTVLHRHLQRQLQQFPKTLSARFLDTKAGAIYDRLVKDMQEREPLVILDISKINCNVFFELGLAIGLNRPGFPVVEQEHKVIPELARGLFSHTYKLRKQLGESFSDRVASNWLAYQSDRMNPEFIHMLGWTHGMTHIEPQPYLVVIDHNRFNDMSGFRRSVEKAARELNLSVEYVWDIRDRLVPHREIRAGTMVPTLYSLIRNATAVIARQELIDDNVEQASRFIATGIAKGLEENLQRPGVILCHRERKPEGERTSIPSDLYGLHWIAFDPDELRLFAREVESQLRSVIGRSGEASPPSSSKIKAAASEKLQPHAFGRRKRT